MAPPDVYRDQLLALGNGYALYEPDPDRELHVRVGDVGHIDPSTGHFHRLFNAFCSRESPVNKPHGVPEHFKPLSKELQSVFSRTALSVGTYSSRDVSSLQGDFTMQSAVLPVGTSIQLSCSSEQGAALILKEGAIRTDSSKVIKLGEELKYQYKTWYSFLCDTFGRMPLRNMVFVTGCDLTTDWATATFLEKAKSGKVSFKVSDPHSDSVSVTLWGDWETSTSVPVRCGPSADQKAHHIKGEPTKNQCIFVRGWRVSERIRPLPLKLQAAAEPKDDRRQADDDDDNKTVSLLSIGETSPDDIPVGRKKKDKHINKKATKKNKQKATNEDVHQLNTLYDEAFEELFDTHPADNAVFLHDIDIIKFMKGRTEGVKSSQPISWNYDQFPCGSYRSRLNIELQLKKCKSEWTFKFSGPQNAGEWIAILTINGHEYKGRSTKKKLAQELTAKAALDGQDWGNSHV